MTDRYPVWHPPQAVLEIVELVLEGALPALPDVLALLGAGSVAQLAASAVRLDRGHDAPPPAARPLLLEDAEGNTVARLDEGERLVGAGTFTGPPLRTRRRGPAALPDAADTFTVAVSGLPAADDVDAVLRDTARQGLRPRWLVLVGSGRGPLPPEAAWRAVLAFADGADVVPVAVPRLPGPTGEDPLAAEVVRRYAPAGHWRVLPPAAPEAVTLPEPVRRELARAVPAPARRGVTVFFTGLSGSGKSTLAQALTSRLREDGRRTVTLLDGDEVRRLLSHGLGFSRADRDLNIRRIGFVATEVTRHGGMAVCAPIAPFAAVRAQVRAAVEEVGDLVLVHVATPLAECERRDRKGLYARARQGEIPDFTGISSPYEPPEDADLVVDTSGRPVADCLDDVWGLLAGRGYLG